MTSVNPSWSRLITDASFHMSGCKITRPRLDKIWNLATDGFSPEAFVRIATERKTGELSSEIEATTIDALIEAVQRATLPGNAENVDNLQLVVSERGSVRSVSIMINGHALGPKVEVSVVDEDPGWVRGRIGGLRALFTDTRNGWFLGHGRLRFYLGLAAFITGFPVNVMVASILPFVHTIPARVALFIGGLVILTSICYVFGHWMDRRSRTELRLHEPPRAKVDIAVWGLLVGVLGVLVAIISSLAAHHIFPPAHASGAHGGQPANTPLAFPGFSPGTAQRAAPAPAADSPAADGPGTDGRATDGRATDGRATDPPGDPGSPAADAQPASAPARLPGLSVSWAQAGVSWAPEAYAVDLRPGSFPGLFPGLGASWAQAGLSWAHAIARPADGTAQPDAANP